MPPEMAALIAPQSPAKMASLKRKFEESEMELELQKTHAELHAANQRIAAVKAKSQRVVERRVETSKRQGLIEDLQRCLHISASLDVVFVLDTTQSMRDYIKTARDNIKELVDGLARIYPEITLRVAFVGYKDHCNGDKRLSVLRFTTDLTAFRNKLAEQEARGGCGAFAYVLGGLKIAETMEWRSATRILYHIGDTPCHGVPEFHDNRGDSHPGGDPNGIKAVNVLTALRTLGVQYYFGKVTNLTDKMVKRFNEIMKGDKPFVVTTPLNAATMMSVVTSSVSTSMTPTLSTSARTDGEKVKMRDVELDDTVPTFTAKQKGAEQGHRYRLKPPDSSADLISRVTDVCLEPHPDLKLAAIKMATKPFAKGAMKAAYYGFDCVTNTHVVFKTSMAENASQRTHAKYEAFLACHHVAGHLAVEFNKIKPQNCPAVDFVEISVVHLRERPGEPFFLQEERLEGKFEKFNNNVGFCMPAPTSARQTDHTAVQAFSHWTHHVTDGKLMVVDCQGVYCKATKTFKLTDPAVNGATLTRFGSTNMGTIGADRFFQSHVCNQYCHALNLTVHNKSSEKT
eukprot:gene29794-36896_t